MGVRLSSRESDYRKISMGLIGLVILLVGVIFLQGRDVKVEYFEGVTPERLITESVNCLPGGEDVYVVENGQLVTKPRCLTVMNSRLGSRLHLDWHWGRGELRSGVMGNMEGSDLGWRIWIDNNGIKEQLFPTVANSRWQVENQLGMTHQTVVFRKESQWLQVKVVSPFLPSRDFEDEAVKLSSAPFLGIEVTSDEVLNWGITIPKAGDLRVEEDRHILYLQDETKSTGALAIATNKGLVEMIVEDGRADLKSLDQQPVQLIYAGYVGEPVMFKVRDSQREGLRFAYTQWFADLDEVISYAKEQEWIWSEAESRFLEGRSLAGLTQEQKWLLAQSWHSFLGNTWLVIDEDGDPGYYVWEGEFKFLNTVDVAHDYGIAEGMAMPWVLRLSLESWFDSLKDDEWGSVVPHDLGARFEDTGSQFFAIEGLESSGMPVEENANTMLLTYWYWSETGDDQFVKDHWSKLEALFFSLKARDSNDNGIADKGVRMTTYDNDGNLALKGSADSTYLGIKQFASYVAMAEMAEEIGQGTGEYLQEAGKIVDTIESFYVVAGYVPVSFDRSLVDSDGGVAMEDQSWAVVTGLWYPALTDMDSNLLERLVVVLREAYPQMYERSLVKYANGRSGLQLAEVQELHLGWYSHSVMADVIAERLFGLNYESELLWLPRLIDNPYAMADGQYWREPEDEPRTTLLFYPRGVTSMGWVVE